MGPLKLYWHIRAGGAERGLDASTAITYSNDTSTSLLKHYTTAVFFTSNQTSHRTNTRSTNLYKITHLRNHGARSTSTSAKGSLLDPSIPLSPVLHRCWQTLQASKAEAGASGGFSFFGGREEKWENASELYVTAANAFRMEKNSKEAGQAVCGYPGSSGLEYLLTILV